MTRRAMLALGALAGILAITAAWWTLALWPASSGVPEWVHRTRAVCFGVQPGGLPSAAGWLSLVGEPLGMLGFLLAVWGGAVREGLAALRRGVAGRVALAAAAALLAFGLGGAAARVHAAGTPVAVTGGAVAPERLAALPPALPLVDQRGDTVRLERFFGRPVVLAFAYGHCETVCPTLVHDAVRGVAEARARNPALLVVTLDPWRDTPDRLPHLAEAWGLPADARVLGGGPALVTRALAEWNVTWSRDALTGEIAHQPTLFVLDGAGRIAYRLTTGTARLGALLRSL